MKTEIKTVSDWSKQQYQVEIEKNKSIKIECTYKNRHNPKPTSIEFKIGDKAEYDSYNLSYIGTIISITDKTVTIDPGHKSSKRRLSLDDFCWRNWDFNLEKKLAENTETSYTLFLKNEVVRLSSPLARTSRAKTRSYSCSACLI